MKAFMAEQSRVNGAYGLWILDGDSRIFRSQRTHFSTRHYVTVILGLWFCRCNDFCLGRTETRRGFSYTVWVNSKLQVPHVAISSDCTRLLFIRPNQMLHWRTTAAASPIYTEIQPDAQHHYHNISSCCNCERVSVSAWVFRFLVMVMMMRLCFLGTAHAWRAGQ